MVVARTLSTLNFHFTCHHLQHPIIPLYLLYKQIELLLTYQIFCTDHGSASSQMIIQQECLWWLWTALHICSGLRLNWKGSVRHLNTSTYFKHLFLFTEDCSQMPSTFVFTLRERCFFSSLFSNQAFRYIIFSIYLSCESQNIRIYVCMYVWTYGTKLTVF